MTTVAWDGKTMAADTLATDNWGMKEHVNDKVWVGSDFLCGGAGEHHQLRKWRRMVEKMTLSDLLMFGYPDYDKETNDPAILVAKAGACWRHTGGLFIPCSRRFHALGSGRDFALAAMRLGKDAFSAVEVAMEFDNGTGGEVLTWELPK